ncbi:MAG: extracellular solute-binding protein, partial [Chromatiaceae bacterium]|nr:extracellular solute-binding protein [Chromatiaceae bacterium]
MALRKTLLLAALLLLPIGGQAEQLRVAAAADLKFALDEIAASFKQANPTDELDIIYGSSGKFFTQIQQGAPYDLYFSADIAFPRDLAKAG